VLPCWRGEEEEVGERFEEMYVPGEAWDEEEVSDMHTPSSTTRSWSPKPLVKPPA